MKKFLLLAAAVVCGYSSANADAFFEDRTAVSVTLGSKVTSVSDLSTEKYYVLQNRGCVDNKAGKSYIYEDESTGKLEYSDSVTNGTFLCKLVVATDTSYYIQYASGNYIGAISANTQMTTGETAEGFVFSIGDATNGTFLIRNSNSTAGFNSQHSGSTYYPMGASNTFTGAWAQTYIYEATAVEKTDYSSDLVAAIGNYFTNYSEGQYFGLTSEYYTNNLKTYNTYKEGCTKAQYEEFAAAVKADAQSNAPETGYYFLKNVSKSAYLSYNAKGLVNTGAQTDYNSVVYVEKTDNGYKMSVAGQYIVGVNGNGSNVTFTTDATAASEVAFVFNNIPASKEDQVQDPVGHFRIQTVTSGEKTGNSFLVGPGVWGAFSDASAWSIESAAGYEFSATMSSAIVYATLYVPFPFTVSEGTTVNYVSGVSAPSTDEESGDEKNGEATLTAITGTVAAGTPVILKGSEKGATVTITVSSEEGTAVSGNSLAGTYVEMEDSEDGNYYLSYVTNNGEDAAGFYKIKSGSTCGANKAYLPYGTVNTTGVRGFNFVSEGETTGINQVTGHGSQVTNIYDLQGRRVNALGNGVFIVNGHKYVK